MQNKDKCVCSEAPVLVFSCSGAADVGELSDRAGRKLAQEGCAKMYCLAGLGGAVSGIVKTTEAAAGILVIDGCGLDCGKKTLEKVGLANFNHLRVTDLGLEKGSSPMNDENIEKILSRSRELI